MISDSINFSQYNYFEIKKCYPDKRDLYLLDIKTISDLELRVELFHQRESRPTSGIWQTWTQFKKTISTK